MRYLPYIFLLAIIAILAACDASKPKPEPAKELRIVSMAPNVTEVLFAIGAQDHLVGVTKFCNYPEAAVSIQNVGGLVDPDIERIIAAKPTHVIGVKSQHNARIDASVGSETQTLWLTVETIDDVYGAIGEVSKTLNLAKNGDTLVASMRAEMAPSKMENPTKGIVLFGASPFIAAGPGTFADAMLNLAGAQNALPDDSESYANLDLEKLLVLDPDFVIDASIGDGDIPDSLRASREGRVFKMENVDVMRPGPRLPEALTFFKEAVQKSQPIN